jgi:cytochrome c5
MRPGATLRRGLPVLALASCLFAGGVASAQNPAADPVQALRLGKALLESSCTNCHHHLRHVDARVLDRAGWEQVVDAMRARGAILFAPQERGLIVDYLAAKSTFEAKCVACHPIDRALATRKSAPDWRATVRRMAEMKPGAISDAEARSVADYLAAVRPAP